MDDRCRRGSALHVGAEEAGVGKVQRVLNARRRRGGFSLHRQRFAGEGRLIQKQVFGGKDAHVSWHHVAGCQPDDIAGHQHLERDFFVLAASHHRCRVADHCLELRGRVIGARLLEETQHHAQNHHHENDHRRPLVTRQKGDCAQRQEQQDQRILDVTEEAHRGRLTLLSRNLVRAELLQTRVSFRLTQAAQLASETFQDGIGIGTRRFQ